MADKQVSSGNGSTRTEVHNENIVRPTLEELPEDLQKQLQEKVEAVQRAFLLSCHKDRHDRVKQYTEPVYGEAVTAPTDVNPVDSLPKFDDPYPTHANYAKMLQDESNVLMDTIAQLRVQVNARF